MFFINCVGYSFEDIWSKRILRDKTSDRHPGLESSSYSKGQIQIVSSIVDKNIEEQKYNNNLYAWDAGNSIFFNYNNLNEVISFVETML